MSDSGLLSWSFQLMGHGTAGERCYHVTAQQNLCTLHDVKCVRYTALHQEPGVNAL